MPEFVERDNYCDRSNLSRDEMFAFPYRLVGLILLQSPSLRLLVILGYSRARFECLLVSGETLDKLLFREFGDSAVA
jgi:hypothetical protein